MDFSDIVMLVLKGIVIVGSFASLIALCVYIAIVAIGIQGIWYGPYSPLLFEMLYSYKSWKKAVFPGLAIIGLFVCLFTGLKAMLFWIPDSWGLDDGEGIVQYFTGTLGFMFAFIGCGVIIRSIDKAIKSQLFLDALKVTIAGEREIHAATTLAQLETLESNYNKKIEELEEIEKALKPRYTHSEHNTCVYMRYEEKIGAYRDLINLIQLRKVTIAGEREICRATSLVRLEALESYYSKKIKDLEDEEERTGYIDVGHQKRVNAYHVLINLIELRKITIGSGREIHAATTLVRLERLESDYNEKDASCHDQGNAPYDLINLIELRKVVIAGEREIYEATSLDQLDTLKSVHLKKIDDLKERGNKNNWRYKEEINTYHDLINLIELRKITIGSGREIHAATTLAQLETLDSDYSKKINDLHVSCHEVRNAFIDLVDLINSQKIGINGKKDIYEATSLDQLEELSSDYRWELEHLERIDGGLGGRDGDLSWQKQIKAYHDLINLIEARINEYFNE